MQRPRSLSRRTVLAQALRAWPAVWALPLLSPQRAHAGRQVEEPLIDSVRSALSSAIHQSAPPVPAFAQDSTRQQYERWLDTAAQRLRAHKADALEHKEFLPTVWYEIKRAGLDVALVLGLIQVESNFRKFAISSAGARGYMQVMPFWTRLIGDGDPATLFHLQTNLRFGCVILRHYLDTENGDLFFALGRYNGSRGQRAYPDGVLAARRAWEL